MKKQLNASLITLMIGFTAVNAEQVKSPSIDGICAREGIECLKTDEGIIIGGTGNIAGYEETIGVARKQFERYFGKRAPEAAVILGTAITPEERAKVREVYSVVMPWMTSRDRTNLIKNRIRKAIQAQQPDLEGAALEAVVEKSHAASTQSRGQALSLEMNQGALAHELGHLFFIRTFWPGDNIDVSEINPDEVDRYGGPAPDWLDEMAAVLMENKPLTETRNSILTRRTEGLSEFSLWGFESYFQMIHPVFEQAKDIIRARQRSAEGRAQGGVVILTAADIPKREDGRNPVMFYAQSRGFANYMIEKTGNERIFADIASHIADGGSMEGWLKNADEQYEIAGTISALEADFNNWLTVKYGPGGSTEEA